jgi:hypothetical protein
MLIQKKSWNSQCQKKKIFYFLFRSKKGEISDSVELRKHIEEYYKGLFHSEERVEMKLQANLWREARSLSAEEAELLVKPFSEKEIKDALDEMNPNSALGLDGLTVAFYKAFWEEIKEHVIEMFDEFF